ncbi:class I SAM-dependent methyltransferase [Methylophaga sp.]|uniref:class I SAM-dependent methyltransferase n=1 Tax=Methylophaga sp. TaxID=2024840 RepID=UPI0025D3AC7D|nr:class I SAM-dependent methyltransferase [Methylophaga sp.]
MIKLIRKIKNHTFLRKANYWQDQKYLESSEFKYIIWLYEVYKKIDKVPGHIVELGVAYGRNTIIFSHFMKMYNQDDVRKYVGFDTFDGYTADSFKFDSHLSVKAWKGISVKDVENRIKKAGDFKNYSLIKGDLNLTLAKYVKENPNFRVALLYIDCNAYQPALNGMQLLKDFMSPGGIICIDEKMQGGETRALIQFCKENNLRFMRDSGPFSIPAYTKID